jgi:hypothetical protein
MNKYKYQVQIITTSKTFEIQVLYLYCCMLRIASFVVLGAMEHEKFVLVSLINEKNVVSDFFPTLLLVPVVIFSFIPIFLAALARV